MQPIVVSFVQALVLNNDGKVILISPDSIALIVNIMHNQCLFAMHSAGFMWRVLDLVSGGKKDCTISGQREIFHSLKWILIMDCAS